MTEVERAFAEDTRVQRCSTSRLRSRGPKRSAGIIPASAAEAIARASPRRALRPRRPSSPTPTRPGISPFHSSRHSLGSSRTTIAESSRYVHWGATSQDIIDTGLVLQLRDAVPIVVRDLRRAASAAATHARLHARTPMPGRTWLQQATPITFGLKAAGWLDALARTTDGIESASTGALCLQFGGASGTLASLGADGLNVSSRMGALLNLPVPAGALARASRSAGDARVCARRVVRNDGQDRARRRAPGPDRDTGSHRTVRRRRWLVDACRTSGTPYAPRASCRRQSGRLASSRRC